ncbi:MAG: FAD-dependent oxidoreductase, partial [Candidatus Binatia bacterium]
RSRVADPAQRVHGFRLLSAAELLESVPSVPRRGLTGGVLYHDAQMHSSERTTLAFLLSAAARGATIANHVEATGLLLEGRRVVGVSARDRLSGNELEVRARMVASVTGPWVFRLGEDAAARHRKRMAFSKGIHVLTREIQPTYALALATRLPNEAIVNRGGRHIFLIPWRGHTLIGTTNAPFRGEPEGLGVTETDVRDFLVEINDAWPAAGLRRDDVRFAYGGLYQLYGEGLREGVYKAPSDYRIFDHHRLDGIEGLVTVLGARFTTARRLAADCVDLVFRKLGKALPACATAATPLRGGDIERLEPFLERETRRHSGEIGEAAIRELLSSYGTRYEDVLSLRHGDPALGRPVSPGRPVLGAAIL